MRAEYASVKRSGRPREGRHQRSPASTQPTISQSEMKRDGLTGSVVTLICDDGNRYLDK